MHLSSIKDRTASNFLQLYADLTEVFHCVPKVMKCVGSVSSLTSENLDTKFDQALTLDHPVTPVLTGVKYKHLIVSQLLFLPSWSSVTLFLVSNLWSICKILQCLMQVYLKGPTLFLNSEFRTGSVLYYCSVVLCTVEVACAKLTRSIARMASIMRNRLKNSRI